MEIKRLSRIEKFKKLRDELEFKRSVITNFFKKYTEKEEGR